VKRKHEEQQTIQGMKEKKVGLAYLNGSCFCIFAQKTLVVVQCSFFFQGRLGSVSFFLVNMYIVYRERVEPFFFVLSFEGK